MLQGVDGRAVLADQQRGVVFAIERHLDLGLALGDAHLAAHSQRTHDRLDHRAGAGGRIFGQGSR